MRRPVLSRALSNRIAGSSASSAESAPSQLQMMVWTPPRNAYSIQELGPEGHYLEEESRVNDTDRCRSRQDGLRSGDLGGARGGDGSAAAFRDRLPALPRRPRARGGAARGLWLRSPLGA